MGEEENKKVSVEEAASSKTEQFEWKRLLGVVLLVLFTAVVVFGITYYLLDKSAKEDAGINEEVRSEMQNEIDDLRASLSDKVNDNSDLLVYDNSEFGFKFDLTDSWKGYEVKKVPVEGVTATWYFNVPTSDTTEIFVQGTETSSPGFSNIFAISAYTQVEWDENQQTEAEGARATYLGENDKYVFGFSHAQYGADDTSAANDDVSALLDTFIAY